MPGPAVGPPASSRYLACACLGCCVRARAERADETGKGPTQSPKCVSTSEERSALCRQERARVLCVVTAVDPGRAELELFGAGSTKELVHSTSTLYLPASPRLRRCPLARTESRPTHHPPGPSLSRARSFSPPPPQVLDLGHADYLNTMPARCQEVKLASPHWKIRRVSKKQVPRPRATAACLWLFRAAAQSTLATFQKDRRAASHIVSPLCACARRAPEHA